MAKKPKLTLNIDKITSGVSLGNAINNLEAQKGDSNSNQNRPGKDIRSFKRIQYYKLKSSPLNDYPIEDIEEMENLLLAHGLLEPFSVSYIEDEDIYEIESGDRRYHALCNLFERFENADEDFDLQQKELYIQNVQTLYTDGIYCMVENGPQDTSSKRIRIIIHNETSRPFDPIRTSSRLAELAELYTEINKSLPASERFNVNEKIAQELKGRYSVRHIIRYKNFDTLTDELKSVVTKYNLNIAEISTYHTLTAEEQSVLAQYIEECYSTGRKTEIPSVEEIRNIVSAAGAELESELESLPLPELISMIDQKNESTSNEPPTGNSTESISEKEENSSSNDDLKIDDLKTRAVKKIIQEKDRKETKIKSSVESLQKKSEQLEKAILSFIADEDDPENMQLNISDFVDSIDVVIAKLNSIRDTLAKEESSDEEK